MLVYVWCEVVGVDATVRCLSVGRPDGPITLGMYDLCGVHCPLGPYFTSLIPVRVSMELQSKSTLHHPVHVGLVPS